MNGEHGGVEVCQSLVVVTVVHRLKGTWRLHDLNKASIWEDGCRTKVVSLCHLCAIMELGAMHILEFVCTNSDVLTYVNVEQPGMGSNNTQNYETVFYGYKLYHDWTILRESVFSVREILSDSLGGGAVALIRDVCFDLM